MPTLEELLNNDLGLGQEKTAGAHKPEKPESDDIEKLATELGLVNDGDISAVGKEEGQVKEAHMSLDFLADQLFSEGQSEKVASVQEMEKQAAAREERVGALAFDSVQEIFDGYISKCAEEVAPHDSEPSQALENNRQGKGEQRMETTPQYTNELPAEGGPEVVGKEEQKHIKSAALRKHWLLQQLEE